jgi:hypothetical protein
MGLSLLRLIGHGPVRRERRADFFEAWLTAKRVPMNGRSFSQSAIAFGDLTSDFVELVRVWNAQDSSGAHVLVDA